MEAMTKITPEMEAIMEWLRGRLSATNTDMDDSPLWRVVNTHVKATLNSVEGGFRGEKELIEAREICLEYDRLRGRKS